MQAVFQVALDFALPQLCPSCREPVSEGKGLLRAVLVETLAYRAALLHAIGYSICF